MVKLQGQYSSIIINHQFNSLHNNLRSIRYVYFNNTSWVSDSEWPRSMARFTESY